MTAQGLLIRASTECSIAARQEPTFTERSVAVFGSEGTGPKLFEVVTEAIPQELVDEACDEFGFTVWPATPLL